VSDQEKIQRAVEIAKLASQHGARAEEWLMAYGAALGEGASHEEAIEVADEVLAENADDEDGEFATDADMDAADDGEDLDDEFAAQFGKAAEIGERRQRKDGSTWEKVAAKSWRKVKDSSGKDYTRPLHSRKPVGTKVTRKDGSEWEKVAENRWKRTKGPKAKQDEAVGEGSGKPVKDVTKPVDHAATYKALAGREPTADEQTRLAAAEKAATSKPAEYWGSAEQPLWRPGPNPTVDAIVTRDGPDGVEVLLIQRGAKGVEAGKWAIPGGFVDSDAPAKGAFWQPGKETIQDAGLRELAEETGLDASAVRDSMRHVGTFDEHGRDPRDNDEAWAVTNAFHMHLDGELAQAAVAGQDDAQAAKWVPASKLGEMDLAFDHAKILERGLPVDKYDRLAKAWEKIDERSKGDGAIVNVPIDKRGGGSIDQQVDRWKKGEAKKRKDESKERQKNRLEARDLYHRVKDRLIQSKVPGKTPSQIDKWIRSTIQHDPDRALAILKIAQKEYEKSSFHAVLGNALLAALDHKDDSP
jgi:ADP-ribose pyrophosphatase YjhB (NUDIX family)